MSDRSIVKAKRRRQALLVVVGVLAGMLQHLGVAAASPPEDSFAAADVGEGNLVQNSDFASDGSGWQPVAGTWVHSSVGFTGDLFAAIPNGGGSLHGNLHADGFNSYIAVSQCIPLGSAAANRFFYFEAWAAVPGDSGLQPMRRESMPRRSSRDSPHRTARGLHRSLSTGGRCADPRPTLPRSGG